METRDILIRLKNGEISIDEAEQYFRGQPFEEDLGGEQGYAKLDTHRKIRQGFPEVINFLWKYLESCTSMMGKCWEPERLRRSMSC